MNLNSTIGIISSFVLFVPILLIVGLRLFTNRSFLALAIYYFIASAQTLMQQNVIVAPLWLSHSLGIVDNLLDAPLILVFILFFSISSLMTKRILTGILGFVCFEVLILVVFGFNIRTVKIVLGPDFCAVLILSYTLFLRNVRLAITNSKSLGKAVMISSVLFSYSIFSLVYIFYYLAKTEQYKDDSKLIYYLVTILSALLMSIGILIENKRIKKLDELKNTRRELASLYGEKKVAALDKASRLLNILGYQ